MKCIKCGVELTSEMFACCMQFSCGCSICESEKAFKMEQARIKAKADFAIQQQKEELARKSQEEQRIYAGRFKNFLELSAPLCYPLDRKKCLLVTDASIGAPLQRWSIPSRGSYLSVRGAHPGANRLGIIFFACGPCLCRERQATL